MPRHSFQAAARAIPLPIRIFAGVAAAAASLALLPRSRRPRALQPGAVVVITGGSRGLGLALAERFGRAGARLVLAARNGEELTAARLILIERGAVASPDHVLLFPADLTDPARAADLIETSIRHFGRVDVLVNDAGIIEVGPFENQPASAYERAMQINFFAALHTIQAVVPHMLERHRAGRRHAGSIVNIASIGGKFAMPHLLPYVASKFALVGLSEGLHAELRGQGIRVTTVNPGLMRTGSHVQAHFTGQKQKEFRWFSIGATTPLIAATTADAADKIYHATVAGRAEITITPQAWLAARAVGLAPAFTQVLAAAVNQYLLPAPLPLADDAPTEDRPTPGIDLERSGQPLAPLTPSATAIRARHNQPTA